MTFVDSQPRDAQGKWTSSGGFSAAGVTLKPTSSKADKADTAQYHAHRAATYAKRVHEHVLAYHAATSESEKAGHALLAASNLKKMRAAVKNSDKAAQAHGGSSEKAHAMAAKLALMQTEAHHGTIGATGQKPVSTPKPMSLKAQYAKAGTMVAAQKPVTPAKAADVAALKAAIAGKLPSQATAENAPAEIKTAFSAMKDRHQSGDESLKSDPAAALEYYKEAQKHAETVMAATASPAKDSAHYAAAASILHQVKYGQQLAQIGIEEKTTGKTKLEKAAAKTASTAHLLQPGGIIPLTHFQNMRSEMEQRIPKGPEADAVGDYVSGSEWANGPLRKAEGDIDELKPGTRKKIEALDAALDRGHTLDHDVILHRGTDGADFYKKVSEGGSYIEHAYLSTSAGGKAAFASKPVAMHIHVPAGVKLPAIPSQLSSENEVLLPRSARITITKIEQIGGKLHVHAEWTPVPVGTER